MRPTEFSNKKSVDRVAVFNQNFVQIFPNARVMKATVNENAKVMEHPLETGSIITDHRIILPVEIELSLLLVSDDYTEVYKVIRQYYLNGTLLIVQTNAGIYEDQIIASIPHEEDPDQYDTLILSMRLKQALFAQARFTFSPSNPEHQSAVDRGTQQGKEIPSASAISQVTTATLQGAQI